MNNPLRFRLFAWLDAQLGVNSAPAKLCVMAAASAFTRRPVPLAVTYEHGAEHRFILELCRSLLGDLGVPVLKSDADQVVELSLRQALPGSLAHFGILATSSLNAIHFVPRRAVELAPARAEFVVTHLDESPTQARITAEALLGRHTVAGRSNWNAFGRLADGLQQHVRQLATRDWEFELPDAAAWLPADVAAHGPWRVQQLINLVCSFVALDLDVSTSAARVPVTVADVDAIRDLCTAARVTDDWPTCPAYALRFLELLRAIDWDSAGLSLAAIVSQLNSKFASLAADPALVPSPVPGVATGAWEAQTVRRRLRLLTHFAFVTSNEACWPPLFSLTKTGKTVDILANFWRCRASATPVTQLDTTVTPH